MLTSHAPPGVTFHGAHPAGVNACLSILVTGKFFLNNLPGNILKIYYMIYAIKVNLLIICEKSFT